MAARAISFDARKIAMGGTILPDYSESYVQNPAYLRLRDETPTTIPIPLGLILFLSDLPSFDPNADDFDVFELTNLLLNPPFYLELLHRDAGDSNEIFIDVAEDYAMVDLDNLQSFIPRGPVESGLFSVREPRVGYTWRDIHFAVSPFVLMEGRFENSENLERVLAEAEPLAPETDYTVASHATVNAGMAIHAGYAFELQNHFDLWRSPRVFVGLNGKYLLGFLYGDVDLTSGLHTFDPIFDADQPPELSVNTLLDYAVPERGDIGPKGRGFGIDAGMLLRFESLDIGFGIQDLYTRLDWRASRERFVFNDSTNELDRTTLFEDRSVRADIPRSFAFSIAYRDMESDGWGDDAEPGDYMIASNFRVIDGDVSFHVGGETYTGPGPIAIRFGAFNQGERIQASLGAGIPLRFFHFDFAFTTHNSTFQERRGLTFATSISFP
jgi:hypothetical protein